MGLPARTLSQALEDDGPACIGDESFTADEVTPAGDERLAAVCRRCPIRVECEADARAGRPRWGFWAGRRYGLPKPSAKRAARAPRERPTPPEPEPPRPITVGEEFENVSDAPGRRIVVTEVVPLGDSVVISYEILAAAPGAKNGWHAGDHQLIVPSALLNARKYRRLAHTP